MLASSDTTGVTTFMVDNKSSVTATISTINQPDGIVEEFFLGSGTKTQVPSVCLKH